MTPRWRSMTGAATFSLRSSRSFRRLKPKSWLAGSGPAVAWGRRRLRSNKPPQLLAELLREHARLMLLGEQIAALDAAPSAAPTAMRERRALLQKLKGLGPVLAATLTNEVFYKDFRNRREVAGYCGLSPSPWRSGGTEREQGISKAGNPRARAQAIELSWLWLRHQPGSALSAWFRARTQGASKRIRRIAIVALARQLIVALWRYLTTGLVPERAAIAA